MEARNALVRVLSSTPSLGSCPGSSRLEPRCGGVGLRARSLPALGAGRGAHLEFLQSAAFSCGSAPAARLAWAREGARFGGACALVPGARRVSLDGSRVGDGGRRGPAWRCASLGTAPPGWGRRRFGSATADGSLVGCVAAESRTAWTRGGASGGSADYTPPHRRRPTRPPRRRHIAQSSTARHRQREPRVRQLARSGLRCAHGSAVPTAAVGPRCCGEGAFRYPSPSHPRPPRPEH